MADNMAWLDGLLNDWADDEDRIIRAADRAGAARVSPELDETLRALADGALPAAPVFGEPAPNITGKSGRLPRAAAIGGLSGTRLALIGAAAALLLCAGTVAAFPTLRGALLDLVGVEQTAPGDASQDARRGPGDYLIPSPGANFTLTDEARTERLAVSWFTSDRQQLMVQIAYLLPEDPADDPDAEAVELRGLPGFLCERGCAVLLTLRDGEVWIHLQYFNADRETALAYAEALAEANGISNTINH